MILTPRQINGHIRSGDFFWLGDTMLKIEKARSRQGCVEVLVNQKWQEVTELRYKHQTISVVADGRTEQGSGFA